MKYLHLMLQPSTHPQIHKVSFLSTLLLLDLVHGLLILDQLIICPLILLLCQSRKPYEKSIVFTTNGTEATVIGKSSFSLDKLNLDSVLIVHSLDFNLISVSLITTSLNCVVIFWPHYCVFKDNKTRKTIRCGTRK